MTKTCIQCGKEFELSESEITFFEGKGLELPKRCSSCRKQNKRNKAKRYHNKKNSQGKGSFEGGKEEKTVKAAKAEETYKKKEAYMPSSTDILSESEEKKGFFASLIERIKGIFK